MLPPDVALRIESHLQESIRRAISLGGGCVANATRIQTERGEYFLKWSRDQAAATFPAEARGLIAMRQAGSPLIVPEPLLADAGTDGSAGLLLLPWIERGEAGPNFWNRFAEGLAEMHRHTAGRFGFDGDSFIGRLPQENMWTSSWPKFFRERRLTPQVERARSMGRWNASWNASLDRLVYRLTDLLPPNPESSMLHGDLWSGNYMVDAENRPVLIDPAAYFGHREADIAMTELFGGFDRRFYDAYQRAWPLAPGYEERREIYNLYHLINHLNHFGGGYAGSVASILQKF